IQSIQVAKEQYGQGLAVALRHLDGTPREDFAGINNHDDLAKLAQSDPQRYIKVRSHLDKGQALLQAMQQAGAQQVAAFQENFRAFAATEDKKVGALVPELSPTADPAVTRQFQQEA